MQEQTRVKLLLGILGGAVAIWMLNPLIDGMFFEPLREADNSIKSELAKKDRAEREQWELIQARARMMDRLAASLPRDAVDAQRLYREWLYDLAEQSGLSGLSVTAGQRIPKSGVYEAVQVSVKAQATFAELARFLYRFERADLLHRVSDLSVTSEEYEGDPIMDVSFIAEGLCLVDADDRLVLFPETTLVDAVDEAATEITVGEAKSFPSEPGFLIRIESEFMKVTGIKDAVWTVERGVENTRVAAYEAEQTVEFSRISPNWVDRSFDEYQTLLASSPFLKKQPERVYDPRIQDIGEQAIVRGDSLQLTVAAADLDPALGKALYALAEGAPEAMTIDEQTGSLAWTPPEDQPAGSIDVGVIVTQSNNPGLELTEEFSVRLREPNNSPALTVPESHVAWLGQPMVFAIKVSDETPFEDLSITLEDAPSGASVDMDKQQVSWTPLEDIQPGNYDMTIKVTDKGDPPKTISRRVTLTAKDDSARFTVLIGSVAADGVWEAWLFDRIHDNRTVVRVGDQVEVADIRGEVMSIDRKAITIQTDRGEMRVKLGQDLRSVALELPPASEPTEESGESPGDAEEGTKVTAEESSDATDLPPLKDVATSDDAAGGA